MLQHATVRFKNIRQHNGEVLLRALPLLVILLVPHAQHHTLLSIEDLESYSSIQTIKGICNIIKYMHIYYSNDQLLAIALLLKDCQLPSDY